MRNVVNVEVDWSGQLFLCDHDPRPAAARELRVRPVAFAVARRFVKRYHNRVPGFPWAFITGNTLWAS